MICSWKSYWNPIHLPQLPNTGTAAIHDMMTLLASEPTQEQKEQNLSLYVLTLRVLG